MKVKLTGWNKGIRSISLTKFIQGHAGCSLTEAKARVDSILQRNAVTLVFDSTEKAEKFLIEAKKLGAQGELLE